MVEKRWHRGDTVIVRYPMEARTVRTYQEARKDYVVNVSGFPYIVMQDTDELVALYLPEGTPVTRWDIADDKPRSSRATQGDSIRLFFPGKRYEVSLYYNTGTGPASWVQSYFPGVDARFYGWKVDLTSPFARTEVGLDMIDEDLDICVRPDRSYDWRDEDEMEQLIKAGVYTEAEAEELRRVGHNVIAMIEAHEPPFDDTWQTWQPTPDLALGEVPEGWPYALLPAPYRAWDGPLK